MKREAKRRRSDRRQKGQFMTPESVARRLVGQLSISSTSRILEPSFGEGGFLIPIIERAIAAQSVSDSNPFHSVMRTNIFGVEIDRRLYDQTILAIEDRWGPLPSDHNLHCGDYFRWEAPAMSPGFDFIIGNPPFGGTFDSEIEDVLDRKFGSYRGHKLKKETYSFFTAKGVDELSPGGQLVFICSDTFLTINTMRGLRELLLDSGSVEVCDLEDEFSDTKQPMVVLKLEIGAPASGATIRGSELMREAMEATRNLSWGLTPEHAPYFAGPTVGEFLVATGGMTIGKNEWFVREILDDCAILEPYDFEFFERPITLAGELERARLNQLSGRLRERALEQDRLGATRRAVRVHSRSTPERVSLPDDRYMPYNKACSARLYAKSTHVVYWADDGDAVLTFKKDGPWYLHGVGGQPYFGREGLTWQLVSSRINARYLPHGFILDSGAPCGFLRDGVPARELYVILGWLMTDLATVLLKSVINHTRNIQGKDIERLPYPHWISESRRANVARVVAKAVSDARAGAAPGDEFFHGLNAIFEIGAAIPELALAS